LKGSSQAEAVVAQGELVADLQAWLVEAERSGIGALQQFGLRLRAVRAPAAPR
jgi:stearoyl-CoA desaturase (delta-9 desaturase)